MQMVNFRNSLVTIILAGFSLSAVYGQDKISHNKSPDTEKLKADFLPDAYNVKWNNPGPGSAQSMPLGNGDTGLNVWVEKNGDLAFYISKTDAWGGSVSEQDPWMKQGGILMKLGLVHVSVNPSPVMSGTPFLQLLELRNGEIKVIEGKGTSQIIFRIWVDANHPVIRVEALSRRYVSVNVHLEIS